MPYILRNDSLYEAFRHGSHKCTSFVKTLLREKCDNWKTRKSKRLHVTSRMLSVVGRFYRRTSRLLDSFEVCRVGIIHGTAAEVHFLFKLPREALEALFFTRHTSKTKHSSACFLRPIHLEMLEARKCSIKHNWFSNWFWNLPFW